MKEALIRVALPKFGIFDPLVENAANCEFSPSLPVELFSSKGFLVAGVEAFLSEVLETGKGGARRAALVMRYYEGADKETAAASLISVLSNTKSEDAYLIVS